MICEGEKYLYARRDVFRSRVAACVRVRVRVRVRLVVYEIFITLLKYSAALPNCV